MLFNFFHTPQKANQAADHENDTIIPEPLTDDENITIIPLSEESATEDNEQKNITHVIDTVADNLMFDNGVYQLAVSADGNSLAIHTPYNEVCIYNTFSRQLVTVIPVSEECRYMELSPQGDFLACGTEFDFAVYEVATAERVRQKSGPDDCFFTAFHPNGKHFAYVVGDLTHDVVLGTVGDSEEQTIILNKVFHSADFSPNGNRMVILCRESWNEPLTLNLLDTETRRIIKTHPCLDKHCYTADGNKIVFCAKAETGTPVLTMISAEDGELLWQAPLQTAPTSLAFTPDNTKVMVGTDKSILLFSANSGENAGELPKAPRLAAFSDSGHYTAITTVYGKLLLTQPDSDVQILYPDTPAPITHLQFYGDNGILYIQGKEFSMVLDAEKLSPLCRIMHKEAIS